MRACKIVEFSGIHHVGKQFTFALFERFVDEPDGLQVYRTFTFEVPCSTRAAPDGGPQSRSVVIRSLRRAFSL
jgi:hypothetical protein